VEVIREGEIWMPVDLQVGSVTRRVDALDGRTVVELRVPERPAEAVLDPRGVLLDLDPSNNRRAFPR
jgi:hypothetical protein